MDPVGAGVGSWNTELAWHLLTVLLRIGRPAAAAELAATVASAASYVTPQLVERLCLAPKSPLRSSDGVVTVSETAAVAFLRFMGCDVPARPMAGSGASEGRRWCPVVQIRYERKRKASDAAHVGVKRRLLMETDADSVDRDQQQSQQLIVQTCSSVATGEVHLEVTQDWLSTLGTSVAEPSLKFSTRVPLVSTVAKIGTACLQPKFNQFPGVSDDNFLGDMTSVLVLKDLSTPSSVGIPSPCAEKSENIHAPADNEIGRIGEPEGPLAICTCRVEDSEDIEKESTLLPLTLDKNVVGDKKVWLDADLNIFLERPRCPFHCRDTHAVDNIVGTNFTPDQEAVLSGSPNAGDCEEIPSCGQDANTSAVIQEKKEIQVLSQSPTHTKAEPVLHELIHEMTESSCQPSLDKKVEPAALPLEATSYDGVNNRNLNIIAENVEITDQNGQQQPRNEVSTDFLKEQDEKIVTQKKRKKKDAVPKEDKDQVAETAQKVAKKVEPAALPLEVRSYDGINNRNLNIIAENLESTYQNGKEQPHNEASTKFPTEEDKNIVKQKEKLKKNDALPKEDKDQVAETAQKVDKKVELATLPLEVRSYDDINNTNLNIIAENIESTYQNGKEQPHNEVSACIPKEQDKKNMMKKENHRKNDAQPKEDKDQVAETAQKGHSEPNPLPSFKHFVVEEEEGSGGYGIVYRARRKEDGSVFAIKCPRGKAHSHHVDNERRMLERFGGKHFVIKFEGCFRSGELDCFVLQHVKHDRPENLKKEIDLFQLQWYGYCLFRALSSLHKQGIVHRDVKPGNFLFSRDQTKGYLIDFNLANVSKSEAISSGKDITSQSSLKSALVIHDNEAAAGSKQPVGSKRKRSNKIPVCSDPRVDNKSMYGSQAADGSGVTSAKDATSTKASLDRLKQPLYKGRKEIMNLLHEVQGPNQITPAAPVSQRKRVAAPVGSVDWKLFPLTPMPLRSGGSAVAGSGMFNSKGHGKQRREGPCVGTKGFRAPEVLLRSSHQGCKVDVWSAGVTLLYLITGKTPFGGDPEQNMKDIVKLRGSEELWEVAKLHNCESSYPLELFEAKFLRSVDLRTWCFANARRPEFLKQLPNSLFDLVDKCLAVNPRCRITSEDALFHEFFTPCHESLSKQKSKSLKIRGLAGEASQLPPCSPRDTIAKASKS
ncbi:hypothetical protein ACQ4PT_017882 [Festuca glaucescens]